MNSKEEQRYIDLSWRLLECSVEYYEKGSTHRSWGNEFVITDAEYDAMDKEYKELGTKLGMLVDTHKYLDACRRDKENQGCSALALVRAKLRHPKGWIPTKSCR